MEITTVRATFAVLSALRQLEKNPDQGVAAQRLSAIWPEYGLRQEDLVAGVNELTRLGYLQKTGTDSSQDINLTPAGAAWAQAQSGLLMYRLLYPRRSEYQFQLGRKSVGEGDSASRSHRSMRRRTDRSTTNTRELQGNPSPS